MAVRSSTALAESGGQRLERGLGDPDDGEALLLEAVELPADAVELAVGGHQAGPGPERQRGEEADDQLVRVRPEGDAASRVSQEPGESLADPFGLGERVVPFVVHEAGRVLPGRLLAVEAAVGPRLVRVAGEQEALRHGEPGIVRCEGVGGSVEGGGIHWVRSVEVQAPPLGASATSPPASGAGVHHGSTEDTEAARVAQECGPLTTCVGRAT